MCFVTVAENSPGNVFASVLCFSFIQRMIRINLQIFTYVLRSPSSDIKPAWLLGLPGFPLSQGMTVPNFLVCGLSPSDGLL